MRLADNVKNWIEEISPDIIYLDDFIFRVPPKIRFIKEHLNNSFDKESDEFREFVQAKSGSFVKSKENRRWQEILNQVLNEAFKEQNQPTNLPTGFPSIWSYYLTAWNYYNPMDSSAVQQKLLGAGDYLFRKVLQNWKDISGLDSSFDRVSIIEVDYKYFTEYSIYLEESGVRFELSERSKGFQWYFCFMMLTKIQNNNPNTIFLLDEPASNLHIHPQDKVLDVLYELSETKQVIYATHSPYLIRTEDLKNIFTVDSGREKETDFSNITLSAVTEETDVVNMPIVDKLLRKSFYEKVKDFTGKVSVGVVTEAASKILLH